MKYQDLIDKYSNPHYHSHSSLAVNGASNSRLDVPMRQSHNLTNDDLLDRNGHYRSSDKIRQDFPDQRQHRSNSGIPKKLESEPQTKESLFKKGTDKGAYTPRRGSQNEQLRKTMGSDYGWRQRIEKLYGPNLNTSMGANNTTSRGERIGSAWETTGQKHKRTNSRLDDDYYTKKENLGSGKYSSTGLDSNLRSSMSTNSTAQLISTYSSKQNNPPIDNDYNYLSQSAHNKKQTGSSLTSSGYQSHVGSLSSLKPSGSSLKPPGQSFYKALDSPRSRNGSSTFQSLRETDPLTLSGHSKPSSRFFQERSSSFGPLRKEDFQIGKCKGDGKFGKVYPCRHIKSGTIYALKQIPKKMIKQNMMEDQFLRQIKLQSFFNHSNLVKLYGFFHDEINVYLLMEYMEQGTLYSLLKKNKKFPESYVSDRIKEICTALNYLHDMDVVHRDIKLENVVLSNGVAKLCDFGWAAPLDGRRTTYCGTFDYAPPEIIQGKQYDQQVDLWSLGVMTFEMLTGQLPFYNISRSQTIKNILNVQHKKINYPPEVSSKAQDFIEKLLRKNPVERIKIGSLLKHAFLQGNPNNKSYV